MACEDMFHTSQDMQSDGFILKKVKAHEDGVAARKDGIDRDNNRYRTNDYSFYDHAALALEDAWWNGWDCEQRRMQREIESKQPKILGHIDLSKFKKHRG